MVRLGLSSSHRPPFKHNVLSANALRKPVSSLLSMPLDSYPSARDYNYFIRSGCSFTSPISWQNLLKRTPCAFSKLPSHPFEALNPFQPSSVTCFASDWNWNLPWSCIYKTTNQLTTWNRVLLEKLIIPHFYRTQKLITVRRARHWSLPWARWIQSTSSHPISQR
jgi:hypothetical protein